MKEGTRDPQECICLHERRKIMTWWAWLLIVLAVVVVVLLLWWFLCRRPRRKAVPMAEPEAEAPPSVAAKVPVEEPAPPAPVEEPTPLEPDDLRRIEGIGPKISGVLQEAGIMTFAQLAAADASTLEQILEQAGIRLAYPETWPEQARLAAAGEWDALQKLQDELKGGRRE
jgi:predicted flap endonuclease-1-like 5' DNA nuclease